MPPAGGLEAVRPQVCEQLDLRPIGAFLEQPAELGMPRRRQPSARSLLKLLIGYARMSGESQFEQRMFAESKKRIVVVFEHGLERLTLAHCRVLARQLLHAVKGEKELYLKRPLAPECPIVVERGDPPGRRHEFGGPLLGHTLDKVEDRGFRRAIVPGGKRQTVDH
jgi:hypothetical protein